MEAKQRPIWEWLVFAAVFVLAFALMGSTYTYQQRVSKQHALHYQLQVLRTAELLYTSINKKMPENLTELVEGQFSLSGESLGRRFIEHPPLLTGGALLDPFGNPYTYDPKTGWIKSSTPGYDYW